MSTPSLPIAATIVTLALSACADRGLERGDVLVGRPRARSQGEVDDVGVLGDGVVPDAGGDGTQRDAAGAVGDLDGQDPRIGGDTDDPETELRAAATMPATCVPWYEPVEPVTSRIGVAV